MALHPLELSAKVIEFGVVDEPLNRVTNELTELADNLAIVESFSHCAVFDTGDGLMCFDTSGAGSGKDVVKSIRSWRKDRISNLIYTHGHADHIGGSFAFAADAAERNFQKPHVIGHQNVNTRIDRYEQTNDWNVRINQRQFGGIRSDMGLEIGENLQRFLPRSTMRPDETFRDTHNFKAGSTSIELHHARGETDDHLWAWLPEKNGCSHSAANHVSVSFSKTHCSFVFVSHCLCVLLSLCRTVFVYSFVKFIFSFFTILYLRKFLTLFH